MASKPLSEARVLITGASGFMGRHLVQALKGQVGALCVMLRPGQSAEGLSVVHATLDDLDSLRRAVRRAAPDVIFHLAAFANPARDPELSPQAIAQNVTATVVLAEAAQDARFVFTGTCEEYGHQSPPFAETLRLAPLSPYSASKAAASAWLEMLHRTRGLDVVTLRPFLVYGPGQQPPKLIPSACLAALEGKDFEMTAGQQHRELTFVGDVVQGLIRAAVTPEASGGIYNLGAGQEYRILELVEMIYRLAGGPGRPLPGALPDRPGDMQHFCADTSAAKRVLGWQAETSLQDGLEQTLTWMRDNRLAPVPL